MSAYELINAAPTKRVRKRRTPELQIPIETVEKKKIEKIDAKCLARPYPISLSSTKTPAHDKLPSQHCPTSLSSIKTSGFAKLPARQCPTKESAIKTSKDDLEAISATPTAARQ